MNSRIFNLIDNEKDVLKKWDEILAKSFPEKNISNKSHTFKYSIDKFHNQKRINFMNDRDDLPIPSLFICGKTTNKTLEAKYNYKLYKISKNNQYFFTFTDSSDSLASFEDQVVELVMKTILYNEKVTKKHNIKILLPLGHSIFFELIKFLSLEQILNVTLKLIKSKITFEIDVIMDSSVLTPVDYKNNVTRLTYFFLGALLTRSNKIIVSSLPQYTEKDSSVLVSQVFHSLTRESDILKHRNSYNGALSIENSVYDFCEKIWNKIRKNDELQTAQKITKANKGTHNENLDGIERRLFAKEQKIIGLNDFIVASEKCFNIRTSEPIKNIVRFRNNLNRIVFRDFKFQKCLYFGTAEKHNKKINELVQFFAIAGFESHWEKVNDDIFKKSNLKSFIILGDSENDVEISHLYALKPKCHIWYFSSNVLQVFFNAKIFRFENYVLDFYLWKNILEVLK